MTKEIIAETQKAYDDFYADYIRVSELAIQSKGFERIAYLKLREILKETLKKLKKELDK